MTEQEIFRIIFGDATVVDMDWSEWWKCLRLCVIADHLPDDIGYKRPLFIVEFHQPIDFHCSFRHANVDSPHFVWHTNGSQQAHDKISGTIAVEINGLGASPWLKLNCSKITLRQISTTAVNSAFPGWGKTGSGKLIRRSIEELLKSKTRR